MEATTTSALQRAQALVSAALGGGGGNGGADGAAALTVRSARRLGSLWAGYGSITECKTDDEEVQSIIIKVRRSRARACAEQACPARARPTASVPCRAPASDGLLARRTQEVHPPAASGASHERKLRSYQVEAAFYETVAPRLPAAAAVPRCLGLHSTLHRSSGGQGQAASPCGGRGAPGGNGDSGCGTLQLVMADLRSEFPRRWVRPSCLLAWV